MRCGCGTLILVAPATSDTERGKSRSGAVRVAMLELERMIGRDSAVKMLLIGPHPFSQTHAFHTRHLNSPTCSIFPIGPSSARRIMKGLDRALGDSHQQRRDEASANVRTLRLHSS